jgi:hypothetical protein
MGTAVGGFGFSGTITGVGVALLVHPANTSPAQVSNKQPRSRLRKGESFCNKDTSKN